MFERAPKNVFDERDALKRENTCLQAELLEAQDAAAKWKGEVEMLRKLAARLTDRLSRCQIYGPADACREAANALNEAVAEYRKLKENKTNV
jgi:hypothetical protein